MANKTYNLKTNMQEVLHEITTVSPQIIEDQINRFQQDNDLSISLDMLSIEEKYKISLTKYCSKTGQKVGHYSIEEFELMKRINSDEKITYYINSKAISYVASHWIFTDGEALRLLSENDPYGYFVYALGSMFTHYQRFLKKQNPTDDIHWVGKKKWLDHKIEAYKNVSENVSVDTIFEANELMRRYLTLIQTAKASHLVSWKNTDIREISKSEFTIRNFLKEIRKNIENVIKEEFRRKRIKQHLSYADIISVKDIYDGHSNFRLQRKPKELTEVEMIMIELQEFMPEENKMAVLVGDRIEPKKKKKAQEHSGEFKLIVPEAKPKLSLQDVFGNPTKKED